MRPCRSCWQLLLFLAWRLAPCLASGPGCQAGYASRPGLESSESGICKECKEGKYSPIDGMPACLKCNEGSYANSTGSTECERCGPGEYSEREGSATCSPCPEGEFTNRWESASCQKCDRGTFANMTGLSACFECPPGTSSNVTGATECAPCPRGEATDTWESASCHKCDKGTFANETGLSECFNCPPGTSSNNSGATNCTSCPLGKVVSTLESASCAECDKGTFADTTGLSTCLECPPGNFSNITGATKCTRCPLGKVADGGWAACEACHPGLFANESISFPCRMCSPGSYSSVPGSSVCTNCSVGKSAPDAGMLACDVCEAGFYAKAEGLSACSSCPKGRVSNGSAPECTKCESWYLPMTSSSHRQNCVVDDQAMVLLAWMTLSMSLVCFLMPWALRYRIKIQDVCAEQKDGEKRRVIVRTHGSHQISRPWAALRSCSRQVCNACRDGSYHQKAERSNTESFTLDAVRVTTKGHRQVPALFRDTGHRLLDIQPGERSSWRMTRATQAAVAVQHEAALIDMPCSVSKPRPALGVDGVVRKGHIVQALTETHLLLLKADGTPEDRAIDTSKGVLCIPFPLTLIKITPLGVQLGVWMLAALITALASLFWLSTESNFEPHFVLMAVLASPCLALAAHALHWSQMLPTLLEYRLSQHSRHIQKVNPKPKPCPRGPERALRAGQLWDFFQTFEDCIRERTMYYIVTNILKPLTQPKKLSYAELAGPNLVLWFVSHFWGTPFRHFAASIRKHAETVADSSPWTSLTYWICSLSNNQWRVSDEVGSTWDQSSFYLALTCGMCVGTAMVLDDQALPLTRAWCLFEVLQTKLLRNQQQDFEGLWLCTPSGVLHKGRAGVDVAMRIAQRLSSLKLEDASASVQKDKEMIDDLVSKMPGGFPAMNKFIRSNIAEALTSMQEAFSSEFKELLQTLGQLDVCDTDPDDSEHPIASERIPSTASIQSVSSAVLPGALAP